MIGGNMKDTNALIKRIIVGLIVILILSLLYPVAIHFLFKWKSNCYWIIAEWESGDILGYGGAVLTAIGTSLLGLTTLIVQKRTDENNQLLQNHPQIEVLKIEVKSSVCELVKPYNTDNPFTHALTLKRPSSDFSSELKYREFYIICKNLHGVEPNSVKLLQDHCNISFNNGRRRGTSFVEYKSPFVDNTAFMFENCKKLNVVSDDYISIDASDNLYFKFPVVVMYNENDDEFIEDINYSIENNMYGLTLALKFKNNFGYFEESVFTFSVAGEQINFNKTRTNFGNEKNIQRKSKRGTE